VFIVEHIILHRLSNLHAILAKIKPITIQYGAEALLPFHTDYLNDRDANYTRS